MVHRPDITHHAPDAHSRLITDSGDNSPLIDDVPTLIVDQEAAAMFTVLDEPNEEESDYAIAMENVIGNKMAYDEVLLPDTAPVDDNPIDRNYLLAEQQKDADCQELSQRVGVARSDLSYD